MMPMRTLYILVALTLSGTALAHARPAEARIDAIFRTSECASAACEKQRDPELSRSAIVSGAIQIHLSAQATVLGLDRFRLEAQPKGDIRWYCVQEWLGEAALSKAATYDWETSHWPTVEAGWNCPHGTDHWHGDPTANGDILLRVVAWDIQDPQPTISAPFALRFSHPAAAPRWEQKPDADGVTVSLRWRPNKEIDVAEYHFVRRDPRGVVTEFAVSATHPEAQGCNRIGAFYQCRDRVSQAGKGAFRYALTAWRPDPAGRLRCVLSDAACSASNLSAAMDVLVSVAPAEDGTPLPVASAASAPAAPGPTPAGVLAPAPVSPSDHTVRALGERSRAGSDAAPKALAAMAAFGAAALLVYRLRAKVSP